MKNILVFCMIMLIGNISVSQSKTFEKRAAEITYKIDSITVSEKSTLKKAVDKIDKRLKKNEITFDVATTEKNKIAAYHAKRINAAIFIEEQKLQTLIRNRVSGNLEADEEKSKTFFTPFSEENYYEDSVTGIKTEKRLTTQFVLAFGISNVLNDERGYYGDGFKVNPLGYGELGFTFKYRLKEATNLWNLKFGISMMGTDILSKADNSIIVTNGNESTLEDAGFNIIRSRFSNVYIGIPLHLELDFSKPQYNTKIQQTYLRSQRGFRLGLGGFFAVRASTFQHIRYDTDDGKRVRLNERDNFNMNDINFGPSAYIGYRDLSIYFKYDVNPVFKNNPQDINTLTLGLRLDIN